MRTGSRQRRPSPRSASRPLAALLVVALLAAVLLWRLAPRGRNAIQPATAPAANSVRIATWNLRKFSERASPDIVAIARILRESRFDLVAIQEVQQQGQAAQRLRRQLNEPWRLLVSERAGNNERYAFLYRADLIEPTSEPHLLTSTELAVFQRAPFRGDFRAGQFDFTLITVHLAYTDTARRRAEAEALARYVAALTAGQTEKDIIVLGDFNEQGRGNLHYFETRGWHKLNRLPTNLGSKEVYDNILIEPRFTREWLGSCGVVPFDETLFANDDRRASDEVSDHRPVWADFALSGPDDD